MFDNIFGNMFGKIGAGMCRLTPNGKIAVKTSSGYKSWDNDKKKLTNQSNFVFDIGEDFFFVIPTNKVKPGEIILVNGKPKAVVSVDKEKIEVVNYEDSTLENIIPERHVFMGNTYFYGRITSLFGSNFGKKKGMGNMMKMMLQMQMMKSLTGGNTSTTSNPLASMTSGGDGNMLQTMMMMNMMGGSDMSNMFDNMFDFDDDSEDDDKEEE